MAFLGGNGRLYETEEEAQDMDRPLPLSRLYAPADEDDPIKLVPAPAPKADKPAREFQIDARGVISTVLELAGIGAVAVGGFLVAPWLGCMLLGALLVLLGVAVGYGE